MNMSEDQNSADKDIDDVSERHNARMARKKEVVDKQRALTATYFHAYFSSCPAAMARIFSNGELL